MAEEIKFGADAETTQSEEHASAMAELFDKRTEEARTPSTPDIPLGEEKAERPTWLPKQFNTPEEFAEAYEALSAGSKDAGATPEEGVKDSAEQPAEGDQEADQAKEVLAGKGLDYGALQAKFDANGALDETDYEELAKVGISKDLVDQHIEGRKAAGELMRGRLFSAVGGEAEYEAAVAWAKTSLSAEEIAAYDQTVAPGKTEAEYRLAVQGLYARYRASVGAAPRLLTGRTGSPVSDVFESSAQVTAAMRDPRYKADAAYRASVIEKINRSNVL